MGGGGTSDYNFVSTIGYNAVDIVYIDDHTTTEIEDFYTTSIEFLVGSLELSPNATVIIDPSPTDRISLNGTVIGSAIGTFQTSDNPYPLAFDYYTDGYVSYSSGQPDLYTFPTLGPGNLFVDLPGLSFYEYDENGYTTAGLYTNNMVNGDFGINISDPNDGTYSNIYPGYFTNTATQYIAASGDR